MPQLSYADVDALAGAAHAGQVDRVGVPYVEHVRAVAAALRPLGEELAMAGLLHDVLEDTPWTAEGLAAAGVPASVIDTVRAVTKVPGVPYAEMIGRVAADPRAALVKIADNAHNSRPDRAAALDPAARERLGAKYAAARAVLWPAADPADLRTILAGVNPGLLDIELGHSELRDSELGDSELGDSDGPGTAPHGGGAAPGRQVRPRGSPAGNPATPPSSEPH